MIAPMLLKVDARIVVHIRKIAMDGWSRGTQVSTVDARVDVVEEQMRALYDRVGLGPVWTDADHQISAQQRGTGTKICYA